MIYFAQPIGGGPIKIGYSADVPARVRQLESHYGRPLAVLATAEGGRAEEAALHARFAHLRFGRTEQFRPTPELMAFIGRPLLVGANSEAVEGMPIAGKANVVVIRGTEVWRDWLKRYADHRRLSIVDTIDQDLVEGAKRHGFTEPPPKR